MEVPRHWRLNSIRLNPTGKECPGECGKIIFSVNNTCGKKSCNEAFIGNVLNEQGTVYIAKDIIVPSILMPVEQVQD